MEIIVISKSAGAGHCLRLGPWAARGMALALLFLGVGLFLWGAEAGGKAALPGARPLAVSQWEDELVQQRGALADARRDAQNDLNALALQLGRMQARLIRLDALGQRLVEMSELDRDEFDFSAPEPAMGGPQDHASLQSQTVPDFLATLEAVSRQLEDREQKLDVLATQLMVGRLQQQVQPTGRPIRKGWISSYFGRRTDPLSGKKGFHEGIDFAGKRGAEVLAVAAGVVTWAGRQQGYGKMLEVAHGNGLVTRYAHNQKNLVKVGDKVEKGQLIARMGNSGRSTGPHVHLEVLRNGKPVNPLKYVKAKG